MFSKDREISLIATLLQDQFNKLIFDVKTRLTTDEHIKDAKLFVQDYIQGFHAKQDIIAIHLINLDSTTNADDLFKYLINQRFLTYFNYVLLEKMSCNILPNAIDVQQKFKKYKKEYSVLLHDASFDKIINVFRQFPELSPKAIIGFPILKVNIERPELLGKIYELQELFSHMIAKGELALADINHNCITVTYSIFPSGIPNLLSYFNNSEIVTKFQKLEISVRWELMDTNFGGGKH